MTAEIIELATSEQRNLAEIVAAVIAAPLARMAERGCEPPYDVAISDAEGRAGAGTINEDEEGEFEFGRLPAYPFLVAILDRENRKGEQIEVCKPS